MFLLEDKKIQEIVKRHLGFSDAQMVDILRDYAEATQAILIDQVMIYLDERKLREEEMVIEELTEETSDERTKYDNLAKLYKYLFELPLKYPDLHTRIKKTVSKYNRSLYETLKENLPDAALAEILEIAAHDINDIRKLAKQYQIPL